MNRTFRLAAVGGLAITAVAVAPGTGYAATQAARHALGQAGAVFVQTDAVSGNAVAAYARTADGTLRAAGTYPTGGLGGILGGSMVDHLASQGSLAYDREHGLLYAVNAGSNTITVFSVYGDRLVRRQVISSGGTFPVSVAFHGGLVYVLNARDGGSVQGFLRIGASLVTDRVLEPPAPPRPDADPGVHPHARPGRVHPGRVQADRHDQGQRQRHRRVHGRLAPAACRPPRSSPRTRAMSRSASPSTPAATWSVAEAGDNAVATFTINPNGTLTLAGRAATGQAATCWIARDGSLFYASNAGSGTLSGYGDDGSGTLQPLGTTATNAGTVDATSSADGQYLYAETGANGIVDEFRVGSGGSLTEIGSVTVPGAAGAEGIAAS